MWIFPLFRIQQDWAFWVNEFFLELRISKATLIERSQVEVYHALQVMSESLDYPFAERLKPNLVCVAEQLEIHGEQALSSSLIHKLEKISVSTIRRIRKRLGRDNLDSSRKDANRYRREVPTRHIPRNEQGLGHFEVDMSHSHKTLPLKLGMGRFWLWTSIARGRMDPILFIRLVYRTRAQLQTR